VSTVPGMALTQRELAVELLGELLALHPEGVERQRAIALARISGISKRTMERAAQDMGVVTRHNGPKPGFWVPK